MTKGHKTLQKSSEEHQRGEEKDGPQKKTSHSGTARKTMGRGITSGRVPVAMDLSDEHQHSSSKTASTETPSAEDLGLSRGKNISLPGCNQEGASQAENSTHGTQNVEGIAKYGTENQPVTSQTVKKTARKSTGGLKKHWKNTAENDVNRGHNSEQSHDNPESQQTSRNCSAVSEQEGATGTENSNHSTQNLVGMKKKLAGSQSVSSQKMVKKTACKSVRGLKKINWKNVAECDAHRGHSNEQLCDNPESHQTSSSEKPSAEHKYLSGDENNSPSESEQEGATGTENPNHSTQNSVRMKKRLAGRQSASSQTQKERTPKSLGGLNKFDQESIAEDNVNVGHSNEWLYGNPESLEISAGEKQSAGDKELSEDENNSSPICNQEGTIVTKNSNHSTQNLVGMKKKLAGSQSVSSQTFKKTARKSAGGPKKTNWKNVAEGDANGGHQNSEHLYDTENLQTTDREKSPAEGKDLSQYSYQTPPSKIRGRLLEIGEEELMREIHCMEAEDGSPRDDSPEYGYSSEEDDRFYSNIQNIISDANLFDAEDGDNGEPAKKSVDSDSDSARHRLESDSPLKISPRKLSRRGVSLGSYNVRFRSESDSPLSSSSPPKQRRTAATRLSRIDSFRKDVPSSRKRVLETAHSHDDNDSDIVSHTPKRYRGLKEKDKSDNESVSGRTKSAKRQSASRSEVTLIKQMKECSVVVKRLPQKELGDKAAAKSFEQESDLDGGNEELTHACRKTQQSTTSKRKAVSSKSSAVKIVTSNSQKSLHDDSESSSIAEIEPRRKKSAIPVQDKKVRHVQKSAVAAKKLLGKAKHSKESSGESDKDENDDVSEGESNHIHVFQNSRKSAKGNAVSSESLRFQSFRHREKDSSHDESDTSTIAEDEPVRKKSAVPVQHRKVRRIRKSAVAAKKLLTKATHTEESSGESDKQESDDDVSERENHPIRPSRNSHRLSKAKHTEESSGESDKQENDDDVSERENNPVRPSRHSHRLSKAVLAQPRRVRRVQKSAVVAKKLWTKATHTEESSGESDQQENDVSESESHICASRNSHRLSKGKAVLSKSLGVKSVASTSQRHSMHDDSDNSSVLEVEPVRRKSAVPVQHRKVRCMRKSAVAANKLLGKGLPSDEHSASLQCSLKLRRLPIDPGETSVLLTASFLKDISPETSEDDSRKKKNIDEDWELNATSTSSSSSSESSTHSGSSEDSTFSSGSDLDYEPSGSGADVGEVRTVLDYSSGSDFDYEISTSEEMDELKFSTRIRGKVRKKLRKSTRMWRTMEVSESGSSRSSSSSDDSSSGDESGLSSDNGSKKITTADSHHTSRDRHLSLVDDKSSDDDKSSEKIMETGSHSVSRHRHLSSSDEDRSSHDDSCPVSRRLFSSDDDKSDHGGIESTEPVSTTEKRYRSRKSSSLSAAQQSTKGRTSRQTRGRSQTNVAGASHISRKDADISPSLNNSDVENMNSGPSMPSKKRSWQRRKSFGTQNVSSAYDEDALRSVFNIYPCQVICRRVSFNPSDFHFSNT